MFSAPPPLTPTFTLTLTLTPEICSPASARSAASQSAAASGWRTTKARSMRRCSPKLSLAFERGENLAPAILCSPTVCLSPAALRRAHRFLLEIHAAGDVEVLRQLIPEGLSRLISSDRASLNDIEIGHGRRSIIPSPVPSWWSRYGDVYKQHLMDHPGWSGAKYTPRLSHVTALSDPRHADTWPRTAMCNEYFVPLGIKYQQSAIIYKQRTYFIGIGVNRSQRDFSPRDRALLDLVCLHASQAWRNAVTLAALRQQAARPGEPGPVSRAVLAVNNDSGTIRSLSPQAALLVRRHFGTDSGGGNRLPDDMHRWLRTQQARLASAGDLTPLPLVPLVIGHAGGQMTAQLAQRLHGETIVLLEEETADRADAPCGGDRFTPRENEVLHWLRDGKRNGEIGIILGISGRTVEKHLEHLFQKLGVETRTAAVRAAMEREPRNH
jgi:DNA-binding CsgD family transcriptional regulator